MHRLTRAFVRPLVLLIGFVVPALAQPAAGWLRSPLPFSAQVLLSHNGAMWAAGGQESIAESTDNGQHWQIRHTNPDGALLLSFGFVDEKFGYAAGTGGSVLLTADGGITWIARQTASETIFEAAFGDAQHGIIRARSTLLSTTDGGATWKPVSAANDPNWSQKFPYTPYLVARDGLHLMARVTEDEFSGGEFLVTTDGGTTWTAVSVPNGAGDGTLMIAANQYWSVGHEVVDKDKPGGGHAVPMAIVSSDGVRWEHRSVNYEVCHWHGCGGCTAQGCFGGRTSFVPFSLIPDKAVSATDSLARFPAHTLSREWARNGNSLCLLTYGAVECTALTPVTSLNTEEDSPEWEAASFPPLHLLARRGPDESIERALPSGLRCIRCDLRGTFFSQKDDSGPVQVQFSFRAGLSGRVEQVKIAREVPDDVAAQLQQQMNSWLFEPRIQKGKPVETPVVLRGTVFVMNPQKPPRGPRH